MHTLTYRQTYRQLPETAKQIHGPLNFGGKLVGSRLHACSTGHAG